MTRRDLLLVAPVAAPAILRAQTKQDRGKKIVLEAQAAMGGARFLGMRDRMEAGRAYSFYRERLSGLSHARIYTRYLTRPEPPRTDFFGLRERQSFGKDKEDYAMLFTETGAYQITFKGARPIGPEIEVRYRETTLRNILYILRQRVGEPGMLFEHESSDVVENQPVETVTITAADNKSVKVYFHATTKLPVRQDYVRRDEKTRQRFEELTRYAKYRDVSGVQWPFQIQRERDGEKIFEIFSESVVINQGYKDDLFALPSTMKILKAV